MIEYTIEDEKVNIKCTDKMAKIITKAFMETFNNTFTSDYIKDYIFNTEHSLVAGVALSSSSLWRRVYNTHISSRSLNNWGKTLYKDLLKHDARAEEIITEIQHHLSRKSYKNMKISIDDSYFSAKINENKVVSPIFMDKVYV